MCAGNFDGRKQGAGYTFLFLFARFIGMRVSKIPSRCLKKRDVLCVGRCVVESVEARTSRTAGYSR